MNNYLIKVFLMIGGHLWSAPLISALEAVPVDLALPDEKIAVHNAIQGVHAIPGTVRGWLCKPVDSAKDEMALAQAVAGIVTLVEKYLPPA